MSEKPRRVCSVCRRESEWFSSFAKFGDSAKCNECANFKSSGSDYVKCKICGKFTLNRPSQACLSCQP